MHLKNNLRYFFCILNIFKTLLGKTQIAKKIINVRSLYIKSLYIKERRGCP